MSATAPELAVTPVAGVSALADSPGFLRRLLRKPLAVACLVYLGLVVVAAIVGPIVLPHVASENAGDLLGVRQGPSAHHILGTDSLGRDVAGRLLVGTRVTLVGVAVALVVVFSLGLPLGLLAGFRRGAVDKTISWLADLTFAMPGIIVILVVLAVLPGSMVAAMVTFGVLAAPELMRVVRSATLAVREELYIQAAQVSGLSQTYIMSRHVLPRIAGPVIVHAALLAASALLVQTGLAFLGLVVAAPAPSWGGMLGEGVASIVLQPWLIWPPGIVIAVTILALGLLADAVRDATTEAWAAPVRRRRRGAVAPVAADGELSVAATATAGADALLSVERLTVVFDARDGTTKVVDDVSFAIAAGETVGLVGESGCGKTMTAMAILGLLPGAGRTESGRIAFGGRDLCALSERELRRIRGAGIAFISQEPMVSLDPNFRVGWQLAEVVRRHHGASRKAARARAVDLLRQVHLPDPEGIAQRYPHELSGGMAQRVAIARALAGDPKLLVADEPTTALDVTVQAEILELLREIQRDTGMAMVLVTHDWGVVADICQRAVVMYAGQVVERAGVNTIFDEPLHPYTEALLEANPHKAAEAQKLPTIAGSVPAPGEWPEGCHFHPRCRYATADCTQGRIPLEHPVDDHETRCIHYEQLARA